MSLAAPVKSCGKSKVYSLVGASEGRREERERGGGCKGERQPASAFLAIAWPPAGTVAA